MENRCLVSVIVLVDKDIELLEDSVRSVLKQTVVSLEVLLCANRLDPHVNKKIEILIGEDDRVKYVPCDNDWKKSEYVNHGIKNSHGEWIAFLECGDKWLAAKLEAQIFSCLHYEVQINCTNVHVDKKSKNVPPNVYDRYLPTGTYSIVDLLHNRLIFFSSLLIHSSLAFKCGNFPSVQGAEALAFLLRACCYTKIAYLSNPLIRCYGVGERHISMKLKRLINTDFRKWRNGLKKDERLRITIKYYIEWLGEPEIVFFRYIKLKASKYIRKIRRIIKNE